MRLRARGVVGDARRGAAAGGAPAAPDELAQLADHTDASEEFADARSFTEATVTAALTAKRSIKQGEGVWSHAELSAAELSAAIGELEAFRVSDERTLAARANSSVVSIRVALMKAEWDKAATWGALAAALDAVPPEHASLEEIAAGRAELTRSARRRWRRCARRWAAARPSRAAAPAAGGTTRAWRRRSTRRRPSARSPRGSRRRRREAARGRAADLALRTARRTRWLVGSSATWRSIAAFLGQQASHDDLDELKAAWLEVREARDAATAKVTCAVCDRLRCSVAAGAAKPWDKNRSSTRRPRGGGQRAGGLPQGRRLRGDRRRRRPARLTRGATMVRRRASSSA